MDDEEREQFVEELLDTSLKRYSAEVPRPGLEARILAQVRASERATRRRHWAWALAATGAAVALLALLLYAPWRRPVSVPSQPPASASKPDAGLTTGRLLSSERLEPARHIRHVTPRRTRPAQFPTPAPLSERERLLLLYGKGVLEPELTAAPKNEGIDLLAIPTLEIAALEIKPFSFSDGGN